jgi:heme/copper-type cytochrome/quinol oxidase subunit 2
MKRFLATLALLSTTGAVLAQDASPSDAASAAGAAGAIAGCGIVAVVWLVMLGVWIFAAVWVMKDAKRRNSPNATLVTVLTWIPFTWLIGLIVHLVTRPKTISGS